MDELISRQSVIEVIEEYPHGDWNIETMSDMAERIKRLPPIQPKRGRWVLVCDNNGMHFICNKCGAWRYHQEQKFCGECGADMREVTT